MISTPISVPTPLLSGPMLSGSPPSFSPPRHQTAPPPPLPPHQPNYNLHRLQNYPPPPLPSQHPPQLQTPLHVNHAPPLHSHHHHHHISTSVPLSQQSQPLPLLTPMSASSPPYYNTAVPKDLNISNWLNSHGHDSSQFVYEYS